MLLVSQSGDKGASRPVLLTRGTLKWSSFGFTKQFQKACSAKFTCSILHKSALWPPYVRCELYRPIRPPTIPSGCANIYALGVQRWVAQSL